MNMSAELHFIQTITDVNLYCPHCEQETVQTLEEFRDEQHLNDVDLSDLEGKTVICPFCRKKSEIDDIFWND